MSWKLFGFFVALAVTVGVVAGFLPAIFFSRMNAVSVLKDASSLKLFKRVNMRKAMIMVQYVFSLIFISATLIGYKQYQGFLTFDLGFSTESILNLRLQGVKGDLLKKELEELPEVSALSKSLMVTSLGSIYGTQLKAKDPVDSLGVWMNIVDEHYLPLHGHKLRAGKNFTMKSADAPENEVIVNEQLLKKLYPDQKDPEKLLGKVVLIDNKELTIIGVLSDFHYGTLEDKIEPVVLRYSPEPSGYLNIKLTAENLPAVLNRVEAVWKKFDAVHPLEAKFYDDQIEEAYSQFSVMIRVIGFLGFLAVTIASMGLFGMVVFTTETRTKEIGIRKVLGASESKLIYLLSRGFILLLAASALIALPATWFFFENVVLTNFAYHQPLGLSEILLSLILVMALALLMIGTQTWKVARANPAEVLKNE
jgi:putative ABC transport system permease protein